MKTMMKLTRAHWILPVLLIVIGCGTAKSYETPAKRVASKEKSATADGDKVANNDAKPGHSSGGSEDSAESEVILEESEEEISIPAPVTATFLTCGKPHVLNLALNIDCALKDANGVRVEAKKLGKSVVYGVDSKEPNNDVLVTTVAAPPAEKDYDVRYAIFAKDINHIEKVVDSSTFFVTVRDDEGNVIENAVKSFLGVDIDFPSPDELKKMFLEKVGIGRDILGI